MTADQPLILARLNEIADRLDQIATDHRHTAGAAGDVLAAVLAELARVRTLLDAQVLTDPAGDT